jgi:hypothetical protein
MDTLAAYRKNCAFAAANDTATPQRSELSLSDFCIRPISHPAPKNGYQPSVDDATSVLAALTSAPFALESAARSQQKLRTPPGSPSQRHPSTPDSMLMSSPWTSGSFNFPDRRKSPLLAGPDPPLHHTTQDVPLAQASTLLLQQMNGLHMQAQQQPVGTPNPAGMACLNSMGPASRVGSLQAPQGAGTPPQQGAEAEAPPVDAALQRLLALKQQQESLLAGNKASINQAFEALKSPVRRPPPAMFPGKGIVSY